MGCNKLLKLQIATYNLYLLAILEQSQAGSKFQNAELGVNKI